MHRTQIVLISLFSSESMNDEGLKDFMKDRGIPNEVIERMQSDKVC